MAGWESFFVAEVGASAALTGLVFVGVSINLTKILASPALPNRAFEALLLLLTVLIMSSLMLVPDQTLTLAGIEILGVDALMFGASILLQANTWKLLEPQFRRPFLRQVVLNQVATLLLIIAGILVITQGVVGIYWLVPGFIFCILSAFLDSWVLLIEINR